MKKNKYDSTIIYLYSVGKEEILPASFRSQIPYSTISTWRSTDFNEYIGSEYRTLLEDSLKGYDNILQLGKQIRAIRTLIKLWFHFSDFIKPALSKAQKNKTTQVALLKIIDELKEYIGLDKTIKLFKISKTNYNQWKIEHNYSCFDSYASLCVKRHPQQLQVKEIERINKLLHDPSLLHWPVVSIAMHALRKKEVVVSLYSWYKYAKIFGVKRKLVKKNQKTIGLIAKYPNEYLHVDTTYYFIDDGRKVCITFIMDNYSKMILGYSVNEKLCAELIIESIKAAAEVIAEHPDQRDTIIVADGGSENHNKKVEYFLERMAEVSNNKVTKVRALKDIRFSNSPVEAIHRTIKGRYLKNRTFVSIEELKKFIDWAVFDYNRIRPHYKHRPKTPYEAYLNKSLEFDLRARVEVAINKRINSNRNSTCQVCSCSPAERKKCNI